MASVPGYELLHPAGQGSMGRVYVARQKALGRLVALKFLAFDPDADPDERLARFRREAEIMAGLTHPNVLSVIDYGEAEDRPYLVMEYVAGGDLRRRMPEAKPMPLAEALRVLQPISEALTYLHAVGILHRDLKPENILMLQDGTPKVADFGIAVGMSGSGELTRSSQGLGTLGYVAPEQQYRLPIDERADQYSLAALTYEMLTGQRPMGVFKPPSHHNRRIPKALDEVVMRGLQEDREDRFPSVKAFSNAIRDAARAPRVSILSQVAGVAVPGLVALVVTAATTLLWPAPAVMPVPPREARAPAVPPGPATRSKLFEALTRHQADLYWKEMKSPMGEEGERVEKDNWFRAQARMEELVKKRAYKIWEDNKQPTGDRGEALIPVNRARAERELAIERRIPVDDPPPK